MSPLAKRLYHYTQRPYQTILSRQGQIDAGVRDREEGGDERTRNDISFLIDPAPLDLFKGHFTNHPLWSQRAVYENSVLLEALPANVAWKIIETPALTELADRLWGKVPEHIYEQHEEQVHRTDKTKGIGRDALDRTLQRFRGGTRQAYQKLFARPDFKGDLENYYAACVPHVVVTVTAPIPVLQSRLRQIQ